MYRKLYGKGISEILQELLHEKLVHSSFSILKDNCQTWKKSKSFRDIVLLGSCK